MTNAGDPSHDNQVDARDWQFGTQADVAWISESTASGLEITSAIPPVFDSYATVVMPETYAGFSSSIGIVLEGLDAVAAEQPWWLGYLDTGDGDEMFPDAPRVSLYANWRYVLVLAGSKQASTWRFGNWWRSGPDLVFPSDRSWLLSWLWDDDWLCLGGTTGLIDSMLADPRLTAHPVHLGADATPPGHVAM